MTLEQMGNLTDYQLRAREVWYLHRIVEALERRNELLPAPLTSTLPADYNSGSGVIPDPALPVDAPPTVRCTVPVVYAISRFEGPTGEPRVQFLDAQGGLVAELDARVARADVFSRDLTGPGC